MGGNDIIRGESVIDGLCLFLRGRHGEFITPASVSRRTAAGYRRPTGSKSSPAFYLRQRAAGLFTRLSWACVMRAREGLCLHGVRSNAKEEEARTAASALITVSERER